MSSSVETEQRVVAESREQITLRQRRDRAERRFRTAGLCAIGIALLLLVSLFVSIFSDGLGAFTRSVVVLELEIDPEFIDADGSGSLESIADGNYAGLIKQRLRALFPEETSRRGLRKLSQLVSVGAAFEVRNRVLANPELLGQSIVVRMPLSDEADLYLSGLILAETPEAERKISDQQIGWLEALADQGALDSEFHWNFFTSGDSREPELAGVGGALMGSFMTLFVTLALSFPLGVATAVYLEEFAPKSRWTEFVEININNLAAVPSVIFGVLGLAVFLGFFGLTRSTPIVGGLVLAIRTLPIIIIASRAALAAVPPSIREAAMGVGASPLQVVTHHVVPVALPGILTGTIIGMAQALGETAPFLMIGMVAFVADIPSGLGDPSTVLPVQIFLWSDSPERAFREKTAGAIIVLLGFLILMNGLAVWLRQRFEQRF